jgi:hypothetical protein
VGTPQLGTYVVATVQEDPGAHSSVVEHAAPTGSVPTSTRAQGSIEPGAIAQRSQSSAAMHADAATGS